MCVRCISVGVVEALYESPKFGGICVECDGHEKLFPSSVVRVRCLQINLCSVYVFLWRHLVRGVGV